MSAANQGRADSVLAALEPRHVAALEALREHGPLDQAGLAGALGTSLAVAHATIDHLLSLNLIVLAHDAPEAPVGLNRAALEQLSAEIEEETSDASVEARTG